MSSTGAGEVDLIVVDWDGGEALTHCLHSIDIQTRPPSRVLIVDNGSRHPVVQRLPKNVLKIPYAIIRSDANLGFAGAINRAMNDVRAPFVGWVHNDAVLAEKWLDKLLVAVGSEGKIAGAQSIVLRDKTTIDGAGISIEHGVFRQIGHRQKLGDLKQMSQPWGVSGTAALFRTNALRDAAVNNAVLKPELSSHYEDVELCARLRARGWKFKLVPEPLTMHRGSASAGRLARSGFRMKVRNRYLVARAHPGVGQVSALLGEDFGFAVKELLRGHVQFTVDRFKGVMEGLRGR